jgi:uncharacterized protein YneF (UPF0154 family)
MMVLVWLILIGITLFVGYFLGRKDMKDELKSVLKEDEGRG